MIMHGRPTVVNSQLTAGLRKHASLPEVTGGTRNQPARIRG